MKITYPSKIILFGEHTIVYKGSSAILSSVYLPTNIKGDISSDNLNHIVFKSKEILIEANYSNSEASSVYKTAKELHSKYLKSNDISNLKNFLWNEGNFFKAVNGLLLSKYDLKKLINFQINTKAFTGAGLGSSASITACVIKATLRLNGIEINNKDLFLLTKSIEDLQHGNSSGADPAAIINGGIIKYTHDNKGNKEFSPLNISNNSLNNLKLVFSGSPLESTGEMVQIVRNFSENKPKRFTEIVNEVNGIIESFISNNGDLLNFINSNGILLEELGVVSTNVIEFSKRIRDKGGAVKVSGAGGKAGKASGICLVLMEDKKELINICNQFNFTLINAPLMVAGIDFNHEQNQS